MRFRSLAFLGLSLASTVCAGLAHAANPVGAAYSATTNALLYAKPTGIIIAGRCNRYSSTFQTVRSRGGELLAYLNPIERPDNSICSLDQQFYMNNYGAVPLWPYPSYGQRQNWPGHHMTDMRPGSKWILHVVSYVEKLMRERKVDGVFLDVVGARPWPALANWPNWSTTEKNAWTNGNVDLVRRLDAKRRAIDPDFIIVSNSVWDRGDGSTIGYAGEKYVDGVVLEHPTCCLKPYHKAYAGRTFGNLGHRRVLVIGRDAAEARAWATVKGVTHVAGTRSYKYPTVPWVGFKDLNDR
jgi:hypothetical protein